MSDLAWPSDRLFIPQQYTWGATERGASSESTYTGATSDGVVPFSYRLRCMTIWGPTEDFALHARRIGFVTTLHLGARVLIPNWLFVKNAFAPFGTLRGTPTVASTVAQGARSMGVTTSTAGHTVRIGDQLGVTTAIGPQLLTVTADAAASGTALTVAFSPALRAAVTGGSSVVWNRPTARFKLAVPEWSASARPREGQPIALDFVEDWTT